MSSTTLNVSTGRMLDYNTFAYRRNENEIVVIPIQNTEINNFSPNPVTQVFKSCLKKQCETLVNPISISCFVSGLLLYPIAAGINAIVYRSDKFSSDSQANTEIIIGVGLVGGICMTIGCVSALIKRNWNG